MPLTLIQLRDLLRAERSRNGHELMATLQRIMQEGPASLLEAEMALRDAGAKTFLVLDAEGERIKVCSSMPEMLAAVAAVGRTPEENRSALADIKGAIHGADRTV